MVVRLIFCLKDPTNKKIGKDIVISMKKESFSLVQDELEKGFVIHKIEVSGKEDKQNKEKPKRSDEYVTIHIHGKKGIFLSFLVDLDMARSRYRNKTASRKYLCKIVGHAGKEWFLEILESDDN